MLQIEDLSKLSNCLSNIILNFINIFIWHIKNAREDSEEK